MNMQCLHISTLTSKAYMYIGPSKQSSDLKNYTGLRSPLSPPVLKFLDPPLNSSFICNV